MAIRSAREPDHVERADQVDLDDLAERIERERAVLAQRLDRVAGARAVDAMRTGPSDLGDVERGGHGGLVGDVGLGEGRPVTELVDGLFAPDVEHDHLRARVEQSLGGRQAQARRATGDDGYGVFDLH